MVLLNKEFNPSLLMALIKGSIQLNNNRHERRKYMTNNQIQYFKYLEDKRANIARETETNRDNLGRLSETQRYNTLSTTETGRSNKARETETNRANLAGEANNRLGLAINQQHYANQDTVAYIQAAEQQRHNQRTEGISFLNYQVDNKYKDRMAGSAETQASASMWNAATNQRNAYTNKQNADTNMGNMIINDQNSKINAINAITNAEAQDSQEKLNTARTIATYTGAVTDIWRTNNDALTRGFNAVGNLTGLFNPVSKSKGGSNAIPKTPRRTY